jgi:hypothetical protein
LHRDIKLLEAEVSMGRHWKEDGRRWEEKMEVLGHGKMHKVL